MSDASNFTTAPQQELQPWAKKALEEQEAHKDQAAEQQALDPDASKVLYFEIPQLDWSDSQGLADILLKHPNLHEQIIATALGFMTNIEIGEALEFEREELARRKAAEPSKEVTPPAVIEQQAEEKKADTVGDQAAAPTQEPEPGWAVRARAFNSNHEDQVNLFNIATGYAARDANGQPDPAAIARWQAENGIEPDGRIGQDTADKAWQLMPVETPKQEVYTLPDDIPPPQ